MAHPAEVRRLDAPIRGRCLCGAVTVEVAAVEEGVGACHCRMCRRWTGALFAVISAPAGAVTVTGEATRFASSDVAERAFCPRCGSHLWWRRTGAAEARYDLMAGLFDAVEDWPLESEIYVDRRPAYLPLTGDHRTKTRAEYEHDNPAIEGDDP